MWWGAPIAAEGAAATSEASERTDVWELLQPLRDNRPVNGGTGCAEEMVEHVRGLNYEL